MPGNVMPPNLQASMSQDETARQVCVLAGSIGAPGSMKRFFSNLRTDLPVAFIVALPISSDALSLLCDYFSRNTNMRVLPALSGHVLMHGEVIVMPLDLDLRFSVEGRLDLREPDKPGVNPVDRVLQNVAAYYGKQSGAIIFSGIGEDGALGCVAMQEVGSGIWTQSDESSHFRSMPHSVQQSCHVEFSGTPEQLAVRLNNELTTKPSRSGSALAG